MAAKINGSKCNGCGACVDVCPVEAIRIENGKALVGDECIECGACVSECPNEAIEV
ncbi:MAG: 4Fe-4S binding protein [Firmicutes bacterium]|nr:4Fe-4S binding protein [Bacillota bacterium]